MRRGRLTQVTCVNVIMLLLLSGILFFSTNAPILYSTSAIETWEDSNWTSSANYSSKSNLILRSSTNDFQLSKDRDLYIADTGNNRIVRTKMDGDGWQTYGSLGSGKGKFNKPTGVYFDTNSSYLYICEENNDRIVRTKMDGSGWTTLGSAGSGEKQFSDPVDIWFDAPSGDIIVLDSSNNRVVRTNLNGSEWRSFGSFGYGKNNFLFPRGISYDTKTDYYYIGDEGNERVVKTKWNGTGWTNLSINPLHQDNYWFYPWGVAHDNTSDYIFISDTMLYNPGTCRLIKVKFSGSNQIDFGPFLPSTSGSTKKPQGLCYDSEMGQLYIADKNFNRILRVDKNFQVHKNYAGGSGKSFSGPYDIALGNYTFRSSGYLVSRAYDCGLEVNFSTMSWETDNSSNTSIKFQLRSAGTKSGLNSEVFVGPDGTSSSYYNVSSTGIWSGHNNDQWMQYKAYFTSSNIDESPILKKVFIKYEIIPKTKLSAPVTNTATLDNEPLFSWTYQGPANDYQTGYQVLIDDNSSFTSIDYDSGVQTSMNDSWQFPNGTAYTALPDGIWYWKVRTRNSTGNWTSFSDYNELIIDTAPPESFAPAPFPVGWTNQTITLSFYTTDATSTIDRYEVKIDNGSFLTQTSPYELPVLSDGVHNITVRAFDRAGNYIDENTTIYPDITPPFDLNVTTNLSTWTAITQHDIYFTAMDNTSGIDHFQLRIDNGNFVNGTSPFKTAALDDGVHNITVRVYDNAGNHISSHIELFVDAAPPEAITINADPGSWTKNTQPVVTFSTIDTTSDIDHYELKIDSGTFSTRTSPYTLPAQADGEHMITVRAFDLAGNYIDGSVKIFVDTTPPEEFTPGADPDDWSSNDQPIISFETSDATSGIDHYEIKIGGGGFAEQTSPYTLDPLTDGEHEITVRALDKAGNYRDAVVYVYVDSVDPMSFNLEAIPGDWTSNTRPVIEFSASDPTSGIHRFEVKIDSGEFSVQTSPYKLPELADGLHNITVAVFDNAGNHMEGYVKVYIDTEAPTGIEAVAVPSTWTNDTQPVLTFSSNDVTSGIVHHLVKIDEGVFATRTSPYKLPSMGDGQHSITIRAVDMAGNHLDKIIKVYIDTSEPDEFEPVAGYGTWSSNNQPEIMFSTTDYASGVDRYEVKIDDGEFSVKESPYTPLPLTDGIHTITVRAYDLAGNYIDSSAEVHIDTTPPEKVTLSINDDAKYTNSPEVDLYISAIDSVSGLRYMAFSFDSTPWTPFEPFSETKVIDIEPGDGKKIIFVKVTDHAGNSEVASSSIILDKKPPRDQRILINGGMNETNSSSVALDLKATDEGSGVSSMSFSNDGINWSTWIPFSRSYSYELTPGDCTKTVYFRTMDHVGNIAQSVTSMIILNTTVPIIQPDDKPEPGSDEDDVSQEDRDQVSGSNVVMIGSITVVVVILVILVLYFFMSRKRQQSGDDSEESRLTLIFSRFKK